MEKEKRVVIPNDTDIPDDQQSKVVTTYRERKIGNTLYCITSVYTGEIDLGKAMEELTIRKVIQAMRDEEQAKLKALSE